MNLHDSEPSRTAFPVLRAVTKDFLLPNSIGLKRFVPSIKWEPLTNEPTKTMRLMNAYPFE